MLNFWSVPKVASPSVEAKPNGMASAHREHLSNFPRPLARRIAN